MSGTGGVTQISGAIDVPPTPQYEDEDAEVLGEELAELYARRESNPRAEIDDLVETTRRKLRRGPRLRAGEFLKDGRYRLLERMGEGASETTWKAWDRQNQRLVVVKEMVGPWVSQKMRVGKFLEAARNLKAIVHAGLARVHEAAQSRDGFIYLVTDYFPGGRLDGFSGDTVDVLQVIAEVANALQVTHEKDLVHGRITPASIRFDEGGGARLVDFDLAGETTAQDLGGIYVAPEAVERGAAAAVAGDVYSLAMCAVFALNGNKLPYTVVRGPERVIDKLDVADSVKEVLKKAVDWELDERIPNMSEFRADLLADPDVLEALAFRAWEKKRFVIASEHYTALWELKPEDSVRIKTRLGEIYLEMEAWEEAYSCLVGAVAEAYDPEPLFPLLRRYAEGTRDWKRVADTLWNEARDRDPMHRSAMRAELADITENKLKDPQGASEIWTLVLQDHRIPARGEQALRALCRLAEARKDWESYVEHSEELLPHLGDDEAAQLQYRIGRALVTELDREEEGLRWIDEAEAAGVQPLDLAADLQEIRARRGQWKRVIALMRLQADAEEDVHAASRILLRAATIARAVHLEDDAEAIYENMLERAPQHYPALRSLARIRHRSGRDELALEAYEQLTSHYGGRSEEPEASERAADHTGYALLLVKQGEFDKAMEQLEAGLKLQPDNVQALRFAGPLYLDNGSLERGAQVLEKLYALFKAVNTTGSRLEAALQRADAAWYRGRLAVAMRWYNTVLDTLPDNDDAWWGLAKIAIAARGGHPGGDRAPWLVHVPNRFTAREALARLMMGLFGADALSEWLSLHPLGKAVADAGATPGRLACAGVDILARYGLIGPALFERLREAYPSWQSRIDAVQAMFDGAGVDPGVVGRSYRWARTALTNDFESTQRNLLPAMTTVSGTLVVDFDADVHWQVLLSSPQPEEPPALPPESSPAHSDAETPPSVEFLLGANVEFVLSPTQVHATIGARKKSDWSVRGLDPLHAVIRRVGQNVYIQRDGESVMSIDGVEVQGWRLMGGETLQLGSNLYDVRLREAEFASAPVEPDEVTGGLSEDAEVTLAAPPRGEDPQPLESAPPIDEAKAGDEDEDTQAGGAFDLAAVVREAAADDVDAEATEHEISAADAAPAAASTEAPEPESDEDTSGEADADQAEPSEDEALAEESADEPAEPDEQDDAGDGDLDDAGDGDLGESSDLDDAGDSDLDDAGDSDLDEDSDLDDAGDSDLDEDSDLDSDLDAGDSDLDDDGDLDADDQEPQPPELPRDDTSRFLEPNPDERPVETLSDTDEPAGDDIPESEHPTLGPDADVEEDPFAGIADIEERVSAPAVEVDSDLDGDSDWTDDGLDDDDEATIIQRSPMPGPEDTLGPAGDAPTPVNFLNDELDATMGGNRPIQGGPMDPPAFGIQGGGGGWDVDSASIEPSVPHVDAFLEVMSGPSRGTQVSVSGTVTLGRDETCDLCIPGDSMLAPIHCRVVEREGTFMILDNATDRGTVVNGTRVTEAVLLGGETIMAGVTVLRFQIDG